MVFVSVDLLSMNRNTMLCHFGAATPIYHRTENQKSSGYLFFRFWLHCNRQLNIACRALCCQCEFMLHRNVALCSLTIITTISNFILSQCHHVVVLIHFFSTVIYIFQHFFKLFFIEKYTSVQKASQKYFCSFFHFSTFWLIFLYSAAA